MGSEFLKVFYLYMFLVMSLRMLGEPRSISLL